MFSVPPKPKRPPSPYLIVQMGFFHWRPTTKLYKSEFYQTKLKLHRLTYTDQLEEFCIFFIKSFSAFDFQKLQNVDE